MTLHQNDPDILTTTAANNNETLDHPPKELHIAPMMDVSFTEFRHLMRFLTKRCILWTEMIVDETLKFCQSIDQQLAIDPIEHPIVCQLGGCHPEYTTDAVQLVQQYGYTEVNLNSGCPSTRAVKKRGFGAVLMKDVDLAIRMLQAMQNSDNKMAISIKTRIAVDEQEGYEEFLRPYIERLVHEGGCRRFYMHARKVHTRGLDPSQNRNVPPLDYSMIYRLCEHFPECEFWVNGGVQSVEAALQICYGTDYVASNEKEPVDNEEQCCDPLARHGEIPCQLCNIPNGSCIAPPYGRAPQNLRGCMMGRAVMNDPCCLAKADSVFYGEKSDPSRTRREVLLKYCSFLEKRFPRRCHDSCEEETRRFPSPKFEEDPDIYCPYCGPASEENRIGKRTCQESGKIINWIAGRSTKPVIGLFHGLPGAKLWRRVLNELLVDLTIRNCGPAFLIRRAMEQMPDDLLDREF